MLFRILAVLVLMISIGARAHAYITHADDTTVVALERGESPWALADSFEREGLLGSHFGDTPHARTIAAMHQIMDANGLDEASSRRLAVGAHLVIPFLTTPSSVALADKERATYKATISVLENERDRAKAQAAQLRAHIASLSEESAPANETSAATETQSEDSGFWWHALGIFLAVFATLLFSRFRDGGLRQRLNAWEKEIQSLNHDLMTKDIELREKERTLSCVTTERNKAREDVALLEEGYRELEKRYVKGATVKIPVPSRVPDMEGEITLEVADGPVFLHLCGVTGHVENTWNHIRKCGKCQTAHPALRIDRSKSPQNGQARRDGRGAHNIPNGAPSGSSQAFVGRS